MSTLFYYIPLGWLADLRFFGLPTISYWTTHTPVHPIARAAPLDRSNVRPYLPNPPVSFTLTLTDLSLWVTFTTVPNGRLLWAVVIAFWSKISPDAVRFPWNPGPYHEALPVPAVAGIQELTTPTANTANNTFFIKIFLSLVGRYLRGDIPIGSNINLGAFCLDDQHWIVCWFDNDFVPVDYRHTLNRLLSDNHVQTNKC